MSAYTHNYGDTHTHRKKKFRTLDLELADCPDPYSMWRADGQKRSCSQHLSHAITHICLMRATIIRHEKERERQKIQGCLWRYHVNKSSSPSCSNTTLLYFQPWAKNTKHFCFDSHCVTERRKEKNTFDSCDTERKGKVCTVWVRVCCASRRERGG